MVEAIFPSDQTHAEAACDRLLFSEETSTGVKDQLVFLSVVHIFLSITQFPRNALIQVAYHKESFLHPPTKIFLPTLSASDLSISIIGHPIVVNFLLSTAKEHWSICLYTLNIAFPVCYFLGLCLS